MPDPTSDPIQARDLPIALYLNQRVTFDLLAALEGGFAQISTVQEASSQAQQSGIQAGLGVSNPFALLGLTFGAKGRRDTASTASEMTTEELVHTPTSLFARLRRELIRRSLVKCLEGSETGLEGIVAGDFVEFMAILRRSPVIDALGNFREIAQMIQTFGGVESSASSGGSSRRRDKNSQRGQASQLVKQMDALIESIASTGSEDLIAECGPRRFVLSAEPAYFVDPNMNDVIDGTFRIFGKVTRVVAAGGDEGISLLRKSPLANLDGLAQQLESAFASLPQAGYTGQKVETEIPAPTLQLIPIGIFA